MHLRDSSRSHIVLSVINDTMLLGELMTELSEKLEENYELHKFDYTQAKQSSLPRYCRTIKGELPACIFVFGLDVLKKHDPERYEEALHFLNAHREDIINTKCSVILWLNPEIHADILESAPDFADWGKSVVLSLPASEEDEDMIKQAQRFEEMLSRPNLEPALSNEFQKQLAYIQRKRISQMRTRLGTLRTKKEINVFLASAEDVKEERITSRAICDELNRNDLVSSYGVSFKTAGWEDVFPSPGPPQETINRLVNDCDIFICIFHKRFGSFTGKEESGTLEEFLIAYDKWKTIKRPHIMVYFKEVMVGSMEELKDPQLQKVLEFKERIKNEKILLYSEFTDSEEFRQKLKKDFESWIAQNSKDWGKLERTESGNVLDKDLNMPDVYKDWIVDHCQYMSVDRLREKGNVIQVRLPEIFIPLYAYPPKETGNNVEPVSQTGQNTKDENLLSRLSHESSKKETAVDIETLVGISDYLLIEGQPGSGKTTLLKHISYSLMQNTKIEGLEGFMPILIFVKDLKDYFERYKNIKPKATTAEAILSFYFDETENGLDFETVLSFCNAGKAIFLLDGLDEINTKSRDIAIESFADFKSKHRKNKFVLSGRPHGMVGSVVDRFGDRHINIQTLNMEQVQEFIRRWFSYIYHQGSKIGERTADSMISEIKIHPGISALIDNPLMLTAICILYHDGKELPGQRAELYKNFIENLLYKRFDDPEKIYEFLKTLAFKMHTEELRGVDRSFAIEALKSVYEKEGMKEKEYTKWIQNQFDLIEPNCGLLRFDGGQYNFWHLTFQEFLTAVYIVDNRTDYEDAISGYWSSGWYNEVIELYISYLSIEHKTWANQIVESIVATKDHAPFHKWLLASKSMVDMHKDRRNTKVLEKSKKLLLGIIDNKPKPEILMEAGEILGWLDDTRDLKGFIPVVGGKYKLENSPVDIKPFEIGKYPVTNSWFEEFIKADGYKKGEYWSKEGLRWLAHTKAEHPALWNERKWKSPNSPVVGVSWYEAYAFTEWLSAVDNKGCKYRLLEEYEWEAAAAGIKGRKYPWGNEWDKNRCNNGETGLNKTSPVGVFKDGNTPDDISDLSGNVWEWTTSDYHSRKPLNDFAFDEDLQKLLDEGKTDEYISKLGEKDRELSVLRGGSWYCDSGGCRCAFRYRYGPNVRSGIIGFRCARTLTL